MCHSIYKQVSILGRTGFGPQCQLTIGLLFLFGMDLFILYNIESILYLGLFP